ncbi:MAG: hypothetical protein MK211_10640 [Flavobacteriales bacterium]|jgi:hypothetical protein|uniref:hypothetical protein n=1 Tax=Candidatus Ulvibacter alkanivorans TaxID=2267620 RepID=UPI000DF2FA37|nr:hypothetical protein [Candidatus Ulvibacter alkanivorans]MCH2490593.1 hypothetical protein [Flavobacteriales bacterium]
MKKLLFLVLFTSLFFSSCSDDDSNPDNTEEANFYALKVGNTWNYNFFRRIGQTAEFENLGVNETVEIIGTENLDGSQYFTLQITTTGNDNNYAPCSENGVEQLKVRDSLGYLVSLEGEIHFSNEVAEPYSLSENEWGNVFGVLEQDSEEITVEAGTFMAVSNRIYAVDPNDGTEFPGKDQVYYAPNTGLVFRSYSTVNHPQHRWEKRLQSFVEGID